MSFSLTEDFKTIEELRDDPQAILRQVQKNEHPLVVTMKGKPAAVVMGVEQYEWMVHLLNLSRLLNEGEEDIRAGRVRPLEEFIRELEDEGKLPRRNSRKSRSRSASNS